MPTLMTKGTFGELAKIRGALDAGPLAPEGDRKLAGILVPWAGSRLIGEGGIYYVGMATDGDYCADSPQTFDARLQVAQSLCANGRHKRAHTPFWQFLDGLTWALLGAPFDETSDRWGWSNLLKIGWSVGNPNKWRPPVRPKLIDDQRDVCVSSLHEEFEKLRNSLIVIVSGKDTFGVLDSPDLFPDLFRKLVPNWKDDWNDNWDKVHEQTGVWSFSDPNSGNLYIYGEHPGYAVMGGWSHDSFWGSALGRTIHLARAMPRFSSK